jgi:hypothetical protein
MLSEMGSVDAVPHYLARVKDPKDSFRLMGFGHRVYKAYDPRAKIMRQITHQVASPALTDSPTPPTAPLATGVCATESERAGESVCVDGESLWV